MVSSIEQYKVEKIPIKQVADAKVIWYIRNVIFKNEINFIINHTIFDFNVLNCVKFKSSDLRIYLGLKTSAAIILIQTEDLVSLIT